MKKIVAFALAAGALTTGFAGSASAVGVNLLLCEVSVTVEKDPGVYLGPDKYGVETGEYTPYTNCLSKASL
jgi:hypothetical protein